jgi:hypothetical protein
VHKHAIQPRAHRRTDLRQHVVVVRLGEPVQPVGRYRRQLGRRKHPGREGCYGPTISALDGEMTVKVVEAHQNLHAANADYAPAVRGNGPRCTAPREFSLEQLARIHPPTIAAPS